jgi:hypothetical protein
VRSRAFGFPGTFALVEENSLVASGDLNAQRVLDQWKANAAEKDLLLNPNWKNLGVARAVNSTNNRVYWNVTFGGYWDRTIPLAGEDEEGRIDRNDLTRTRPPAASLAARHRFSGYGDDGNAYNPAHCDLDSSPQLCWRDPPPQGNPRLDEPSMPDKLAGVWNLTYTIGSTGIVHGNLDQWDRTGFKLEIQINPGGTWSTKGYRAFQTPIPLESGTWQSVHEASRNEEVVTFIRQNNLPRATIRIHAVTGQLTFFATDGGSSMKNFLRGVIPDDDLSDDPQIIFLPR